MRGPARTAATESLTAARGALFTANNRTLPADAAADVSRMWMRPLRARASRSCSPQRASSRRARLPRDAARHARRGLRPASRPVLEVVPADEPSRCSRARASVCAVERPCRSRPARLSNPAPRTISRCSSACCAAARPGRRRRPAFVYRWPLADEPLRRCSTSGRALLTRTSPIGRRSCGSARSTRCTRSTPTRGVPGPTRLGRRQLARRRASVRGVARDRTGARPWLKLPRGAAAGFDLRCVSRRRLTAR